MEDRLPTFALEGGKCEQVRDQDGVVAFHNHAHAHGQAPEDGHGIGSNRFHYCHFVVSLGMAARLDRVKTSEVALVITRCLVQMCVVLDV